MKGRCRVLLWLPHAPQAIILHHLTHQEAANVAAIIDSGEGWIELELSWHIHPELVQQARDSRNIDIITRVRASAVIQYAVELPREGA